MLVSAHGISTDILDGKMELMNTRRLADCMAAFDTALMAHVQTEQPRSMLLLGRPWPGISAALSAMPVHQELVVHAIVPSPALSGRHHQARNESAVRFLVHHCPVTNLKRDARRLENNLRMRPCTSASEWNGLLQQVRVQEESTPLFADASMDCAVMALTVNRLSPHEASAALRESARILRRNGKLFVLAILADESVKNSTLKDGDDAYLMHFPTEVAFLRELAECGLHGIRIIGNDLPVVAEKDHAELRVFMIEAYKGKQGACLDQGHAVIFRGPWSEVHDDDGHRYIRGERTAVCAKTYALLTAEPYRSLFIGIPARNAPALMDAPLFDCSTPRLRDPQVTKGRVALFEATQDMACC